jgi:hypothetical protein
MEFTKEDLMNLMSDMIGGCHDDVLGKLFCKRMNCSACDGTGLDGEPNGYGCKEAEEFNEELMGDIINAIINREFDMAIAHINSICRKAIDKTS